MPVRRRRVASRPGPSPSPSIGPWRRDDWRRAAGPAAAILALHVVAAGTLLVLVVPHRYPTGHGAVFGAGLGLTAYALGVRHAFDADHIAAIDNTTRRLMSDGRRPLTVGFWFALGHSTVVVVLAALVAAGAHVTNALLDDGSTARRTLGMIGVSISGGFLYVIAALNLIALAGIVRVFRDLRAGRYDEAELDARLDARGLVSRLLRRLAGSVARPARMYPVGMAFGLGFDTATEVTLLVMAGSGAAAGLPWYAVMCLPLLFAAGMCLFDTLDGAFMTVAYRWAFAGPVRKIYYNLTITGLSIAVAFVIGTIELIGVVRAQAGMTDAVSGWIAGLDLNNVGFIIAGLFVAVWAGAVAYWRLAGVERRWSAAGGERSPR